MKGIAEKREREIDKVKAEGAAEVDWLFGMEATDERLDRLFKAQGISGYVAGVNEGRTLAEVEVRQRCEKFERMLSTLQSLTREARVVEADVRAQTHVGLVRLEAEAQGDAGS